VSEAKTPKLRVVDEDRWRSRPAFSATYARDWRDLCAFLRARFGSGPPDPEDMAQQAFFRLGELSAERDVPSPRAFVFRAAINLTLDERRRLTRTHRTLDASAPLLATEGEEEPGLERSLIAKEQMAMLRRVIEGLPDRHRLYVLANRLDGMTFAAIAQRFGVSESLVRKTIDEAVAVCQRALANGTIDYRGLSRERNRRS
jgi:RNA polymerase sigma-70 factor (ECF subfamily)